MSDLLDASELKSALKKLTDWEMEGNAISRTIEFEEFMEGIDFINDLAELAEEVNHHPDIQINYTKVTLTLTTHELNGLTAADIDLAQRIDSLVE